MKTSSKIVGLIVVVILIFAALQYVKMTAKKESLEVENSATKTYKNSKFGYQIAIPVGTKIEQFNDAQSEVSITISTSSPWIRIMVSDQPKCDDAAEMMVKSSKQTINGIEFTKADMSGAFGGNQSASYAESYCTVYNGRSFRILTQLRYSRYPCDNEKDGGKIPGCVPTYPDEVVTFKQFDELVQALDFKFTN